MKRNNIGILASMSWNSNKWKDTATVEDIDNSNYDYVKENGWMHEDLNFGADEYPSEEDGNYIAYTPMFNRLPSLEESKYIDIVFFRSLNYHTKKNYIVGFYAFPDVGNFKRLASHPSYTNYDYGNLKSSPDHIVLLDNFIEVSDDLCLKNKYLPVGKKLGKMGYNYLHFENVIKILDKANELNHHNRKLVGIKVKFLTDRKYKV